ncbi:MAG: RNA pseudouridine synthase [Gammaproteobacteria bacterium]|nr:MAG: RNA pseudouridine synthase [Gammaproteobacteria bacterium]
MSVSATLFTSFNASVDAYSLPTRFTYPFYYTPHPLSLVAVEQLQQHLKTQTDWQHDFGLEADSANAIGKMFGVLVVENEQGELGYLSAFSGKMAEKNHLPKFVPPVFDMLDEQGFFIKDLNVINQVSEQIKQLELNPQIGIFEQALNKQMQAGDAAISAHRAIMIEGRKTRKQQRAEAENKLDEQAFNELKIQLSTQSIKHKNKLRDLSLYWNEHIAKFSEQLSVLTDEITALKNQRKTLSASLQQKLFDHYVFLNQAGDEKNLSDIFKQTTQLIPPAGAGECAAPKLLHYAFLHQLKPIALAEFWWGNSPTSQIRQHLNFYAACQGKCQPILTHMLQGIKLDENPLLINPAEGKSLDIVYQDEMMVIINKPAEFLSVPGKNIDDSVYSRMKLAFPQATGPLIVHRLDMSTSGLMVIALNKDANKNLQQQFINRTVEKRYVALLDGEVTGTEGMIKLPLRVDLDDRPRQLVCYDYGRLAETKWQLIEKKNKQSKVYFYPKTGRTHQLRVHAAHSLGLNMPIVGDDLYGHKNKADRLHLHAETLTVTHPVTKETMHFQVDAEF